MQETCRRRRFNSWVGKIPWRREWQLTPVFLPGKSHGQRILVGYSPWGHRGSDMTEQLNNNNNKTESSEAPNASGLSWRPGLSLRAMLSWCFSHRRRQRRWPVTYPTPAPKTPVREWHCWTSWIPYPNVNVFAKSWLLRMWNVNKMMALKGPCPL